LETRSFLQILPEEGILLNEKLCYKGPYTEALEMIKEMHEEPWRAFLSSMLYNLHDGDSHFWSFLGLERYHAHEMQSKPRSTTLNSTERPQKDHDERELLTSYDHSSISTGEKEVNFEDEKKGPPSGGSHPPFDALGGGLEAQGYEPPDVRLIPPKELSNRTLEVRALIGIWISKTNLDHVLRWNAKLDLAKEEERKLFVKLLMGFKSERNTRNKERFHLEGHEVDPEECLLIQKNTGWIYPIQRKHGYCITVSIHESHETLNNVETHTGTVRVMRRRNMDLQLIYEHYMEIFDFLTPEEHQQILTNFYDERELGQEDRKHLFKIHLANAMGPEDVVDAKLKGAHVKIFLRNGYGEKSKVNVLVDYSKGPEIEVQGAARPSLTVRKLIADPVGAADSIAALDYKINNSVINQNQMIQNQDVINEGLDMIEAELYDANQYLTLLEKSSITKTDLQAEISELEMLLKMFGIQINISEISSRKNQENILKALRNIEDTLVEARDKPAEERELIRKTLAFLMVSILNFESTVSENTETTSKRMEQLVIDISREASEEREAFREEVLARLDRLESSIDQLINEELASKVQYKNALQLIIRQLHTLPGLTANELIPVIQQEVTLSKRTLYKYLKILQERELIKFSKNQNLKGPGRRPKKFSLTKRILNKLKRR